MPHPPVCPHGHEWKGPHEPHPPAGGGPAVFPACGAHETVGNAETFAPPPSSEATLPAPRRPPSSHQPAEASDQTPAAHMKSGRPPDPPPDAAAREAATAPSEMVVQADAPADE